MPSARLRRSLAAATALPLLALVATACGYGSDADDGDKASKAPVAAGTKKLSASSVR
ncbi:sulfate ABC transporter substrate-binding protein, partial [Streptomyces sp. SID11233]|nr:sulfate ABC transporter substrate-binding protein [Streptomyces sp. SID11233]